MLKIVKEFRILLILFIAVVFTKQFAYGEDISFEEAKEFFHNLKKKNESWIKDQVFPFNEAKQCKKYLPQKDLLESLDDFVGVLRKNDCEEERPLSSHKIREEATAYGAEKHANVSSACQQSSRYKIKALFIPYRS